MTMLSSFGSRKALPAQRKEAPFLLVAASALIVLLLLVAAPLSSDAVCCHNKSGHACCGVDQDRGRSTGGCNMFCCECKGGCDPICQQSTCDTLEWLLCAGVMSQCLATCGECYETGGQACSACILCMGAKAVPTCIKCFPEHSSHHKQVPQDSYENGGALRTPRPDGGFNDDAEQQPQHQLQDEYEAEEQSQSMERLQQRNNKRNLLFYSISNGKEVITAEDFSQYRTGLISGYIRHDRNYDVIAFLEANDFNRYDIDGDGIISRSEFDHEDTDKQHNQQEDEPTDGNALPNDDEEKGGITPSLRTA